MRNISSSPLWSSWFTSSLTPDILSEGIYQKSYVELLVYLLTDFILFMENISRSPLWYCWSNSLLVSYNLNNEYEQKSSHEAPDVFPY